VHVAGPGLTRQQPDAVGQLGVLVEVDTGVLGDVEHPVVGGHQQRRVVREPVHELLDHPVDQGELGAPGRGVDAPHVSGEVELGDVAVDEGPGSCGEAGQHQRREVAVADRPRVGGAAVDGAGEPGAGVGVRADGGDLDARVGGLLEDGPLRLPGVRVGVVGPLHVVEDAVLPGGALLAGDGGDEAEDAVAAGRKSGAEGGEADRGGARARGGQVAHGSGQRGQGRRDVRVGAHQVGTEAVDQQDGHPAGPA
jgi:hypothetical protein